MPRERNKVIFALLVIAIAIAIAMACRMFVVEFYKVAPKQMENTLLAGDRICVDKWCYGLHTPTVAKRNDVVVFHYPQSDTLSIAQLPTAIARCIGISGDIICTHNGQLAINGKASAQSPQLIEAYSIADTLHPQVDAVIAQTIDLPIEQHDIQDVRLYYLDRYQYNKLCNLLPDSIALHPVSLAQDNYRIELPPYGTAATITPQNAAFYADIINRYEPQKVELRGEKLYRDGVEIKQYNFSQPYYWVLCDNRTAVTDSRTFGVLPHSHLIGKCRYILYSVGDDNKIRTQRTLQRIAP